MAQNYRLKKGVLLQAFGDASKTVTNDSPHFTDALAEWYLKNQPGVEKYFEVMPGRPASVTNIPRPVKQSGPTIIIPPEAAIIPHVNEPTVILEPVIIENLIAEPKKKPVNKKK